MHSKADRKHYLDESKVFCMAPWIHMHVWPNGRAFPCCLADPAKGDYGNTNSSTLKELWNSETARRLRKNMLNHKPSAECGRCYKLEKDSNAFTLRKNMNTKFRHHYERVWETQDNGHYERMNFTYMDFRFSNMCNMSCRSCSPTFSTAWYDDYVKRYGSVPPDIAPQKFMQLKNKPGWKEELWPYLDTVEEVYWAGGEPMIESMHWEIMNHWVETGHAENVSVLYTTNFSQLEYKRQNILDLWPKFKHVNVSASLDAMGSHAEYIRKGTVWEDVVANRKLMIERTPWLTFDICPTVSALNVMHLPDFIYDWTYRDLLKAGAVRINNLLDPSFLCVNQLPTEYKDEAARKWRDLVAWSKNHRSWLPDPYPQNCFEDAVEGLINFMYTDTNQNLAQTKQELIGWDVIRNEKWSEAVPELAGAFEEAGVE